MKSNHAIISNAAMEMEPDSSHTQMALFSIEEMKSHYLLELDIPTIHSCETEILSKQYELTVEGKSTDDSTLGKQVFFRCRPFGQGIKASYKDGVLQLRLPKNRNVSPSNPFKIL
ncbi:MAG: Hsp20/alpha crystallin family protein [Pseudobdellovibrio sp.]